jgi:hypothetical protein
MRINISEIGKSPEIQPNPTCDDEARRAHDTNINSPLWPSGNLRSAKGMVKDCLDESRKLFFLAKVSP